MSVQLNNHSKFLSRADDLSSQVVNWTHITRNRFPPVEWPSNLTRKKLGTSTTIVSLFCRLTHLVQQVAIFVVHKVQGWVRSIHQFVKHLPVLEKLASREKVASSVPACFFSILQLRYNPILSSSSGEQPRGQTRASCLGGLQGLTNS